MHCISKRTFSVWINPQIIFLYEGALPECLTDGVDVMTELQQQEMKILEEVLKYVSSVYFLSLILL